MKVYTDRATFEADLAEYVNQTTYRHMENLRHSDPHYDFYIDPMLNEAGEQHSPLEGLHKVVGSDFYRSGHVRFSISSPESNRHPMWVMVDTNKKRLLAHRSSKLSFDFRQPIRALGFDFYAEKPLTIRTKRLNANCVYEPCGEQIFWFGQADQFTGIVVPDGFQRFSLFCNSMWWVSGLIAGQIFLGELRD